MIKHLSACIINKGPVSKMYHVEPYEIVTLGRSKMVKYQHLHMIQSNVCVRAKLLQVCPTPCDPMDCSPHGSSVHGIFQASVLEWVAISSFRRSS